MQASFTALTDPGSLVTASMLGDVERRGRTEADHVLCDLLLRRGDAPVADLSLLRVAYVAVKAAETRATRCAVGQANDTSK